MKQSKTVCILSRPTLPVKLVRLRPFPTYPVVLVPLTECVLLLVARRLLGTEMVSQKMENITRIPKTLGSMSIIHRFDPEASPVRLTNVGPWNFVVCYGPLNMKLQS